MLKMWFFVIWKTIVWMAQCCASCCLACWHQQNSNTKILLTGLARMHAAGDLLGRRPHCIFILVASLCHCLWSFTVFTVVKRCMVKWLKECIVGISIGAVLDTVNWGVQMGGLQWRLAIAIPTKLRHLEQNLVLTCMRTSECHTFG